jgi:hypothetical protein
VTDKNERLRIRMRGLPVMQWEIVGQLREDRLFEVLEAIAEALGFIGPDRRQALFLAHPTGLTVPTRFPRSAACRIGACRRCLASGVK